MVQNILLPGRGGKGQYIPEVLWPRVPLGNLSFRRHLEKAHFIPSHPSGVNGSSISFSACICVCISACGAHACMYVCIYGLNLELRVFPHFYFSRSCDAKETSCEATKLDFRCFIV